MANVENEGTSSTVARKMNFTAQKNSNDEMKIKLLQEKSRKRRHDKTETNVVSNSLKSGDQDNFVGLRDSGHQFHESTSTKPDSSVRFTKFVDKSKFEVVILKTVKRLRKRLLIFTSSDKTQCYEFTFYRNEQLFYHRCQESVTRIKAILGVDENGNECIRIEDKNHQCSPIIYEPEKYSAVKIVKKPDYEIWENCSTKSKKILIIFNSNDRSQCYEFSWNSKRKTFYCRGCASKRTQRLSAEICHVNTETKYILSSHAHVCEMRKYNPVKYSSLKTVQFSEKRNHISAKRHQNSNGNEYLATKQKIHICSPIKYSSIIKPDTVIREKSGLFFKKSKKKQEIDKNRIVRLPNFELQRNTFGVPERRLIVFFHNDRKLCYDYYYHQSTAYFVCKKCKIPAKIQIIEENDNEKYVILSENKHKCEPVKYEPEKKLINSLGLKKALLSNFVVHYNDSGIPHSRLTIFDDKDKSLGYRYNLSGNLLYCLGCRIKKKNSSAKLITDKDGNRTVEFGKIEHFCDIKNLKKEKLYFSDFKFEQNGNILITNDPTEKNRCYKLTYDKELETFCCSKCLEMRKKYVTATICRENDGKEFVLLNVLHCCTSVLK